MRETQPLKSDSSDNDVPLIHLGPPIITYAIIFVCSIIFIYSNIFQDSNHFKAAFDVLVPHNVAIWAGAYWGLFTTAFVHIEFWHLLFNMWWVKDFGAVLEPTMGKRRYFVFIVVAAVLSSGMQLAFSDNIGIGFSGVVYAMFGYGWAARSVESRYRKIVDKQIIIWLVGWLVLCIVLTATEQWNVGNAAHIGGLVFGYCYGNIAVAKKELTFSRIGLVLLFIFTISSVTYLPWSESWRQKENIAGIYNMIDQAKNGVPDAQYQYSRYLLLYDKKDEALEWLKKSANQEYLPAMNNLAWTLATSAALENRNGSEAVRWAERLCLNSGYKEPMYLDTLAAAYAEDGRWEEAVKTQKLAIEKMKSEEEKIKMGYSDRLRMYLKKEKFREKH